MGGKVGTGDVVGTFVGNGVAGSRPGRRQTGRQGRGSVGSAPPWPHQEGDAAIATDGTSNADYGETEATADPEAPTVVPTGKGNGKKGKGRGSRRPSLRPAKLQKTTMKEGASSADGRNETVGRREGHLLAYSPQVPAFSSDLQGIAKSRPPFLISRGGERRQQRQKQALGTKDLS